MENIVKETGRIRRWSFVVFEAIWTELPNLQRCALGKHGREKH